MGDIADGLINGDFDFYTGEYLGEGQGFPRTSRDYHNSGPRRWYYENGKKYPYRRINCPYRNASGKVIGVLFYLGSYSSIDGDYGRASQIIKKYCLEKGFIETRTTHRMCLKIRCEFIQKDFTSFRNWCEQNIER